MDREALIRLNEENLRAMELFSLLLSQDGALFTKNEVDDFAASCRFSEEEALSALLCAALGLAPDEKPEDRLFSEKYLTPALRRLDEKAYRANPYLQTVRFPQARQGSWRMARKTYAPYQVIPCGHPILTPEGREIPPLGYFTAPFSYPAVLEGGREWMTVTPNEIETMASPIAEAHGACTVLGLGLGYFPFMISLKENVERVTVVERDENAIRLFHDHLLPQFPHREKIRVIQADAFSCLQGPLAAEKPDFAFADLWHDVSDGLPLYLRLRKMEPLFPHTRFTYWIEEEMLFFLRGLILNDYIEQNHRLETLLPPSALLPNDLSLPFLRSLAPQVAPGML